LNNWRWVIRNY